MNVVIALVIFIIGGIGGFFANRLLSSTSQEQRKLAEQVNKSEAALDQYKLDVAEHLSSSAQLLEQMNNTCQTAMKQMKESTQLLQKATTVEVDSMPFFSAETQQQLAQTATLRHQKRSSVATEAITEAPLDYSDNPSGLFAEQKQKVTTAG
ncbi:MAG: YhcB family protein [Colwellia sp.]|nr:YhcB family protein [Colwellia sp.]